MIPIKQAEDSKRLDQETHENEKNMAPTSTYTGSDNDVHR